jgi:glycosyltransferase involved in cell wall biosynthesis
MNKYIVSLIIPVYNVEDYVKESLLSALNQSFDGIEYVVVDDCSTDNSLSIVQDTKRQHKRCDDIYIYKHDKNRGLAAARNTGIENSNGKYIFFMDSDDEITSTCIEKHYSKIIETNAESTIGWRKLVGLRSAVPNRTDFTEKNGTEILKAFFNREYPPSACNRMYLKQFLISNNIKFIEGQYYEDQWFNYTVAKLSNKMVVVKEETYIYKIRNNSITTASNNNWQKINDLIDVTDRIINDSKSNSILNINSFNKYINYRLFSTALLIINSNIIYKEKCNLYNKNKKTGADINRKTLYGKYFNLPYLMFYITIKPIYYLYKLYQVYKY